MLCAVSGVEPQTETVWRQADKYRVPRIAFINKLDREGASFEDTFEEIRSRLSPANPVALQIPVGLGPAHLQDPFRGVIDLVSRQMLTFDHESDTVILGEIPESFRAEADMWRESMLESLYGHSDELMLLAMQEEPLPAELIQQVIREATLQQQLQPVLCGSALHGIGIQPLLDAVALYLPSPADRPAVDVIHPTIDQHAETRTPSVE